MDRPRERRSNSIDRFAKICVNLLVERQSGMNYLHDACMFVCESRQCCVAAKHESKGPATHTNNNMDWCGAPPAPDDLLLLHKINNQQTRTQTHTHTRRARRTHTHVALVRRWCVKKKVMPLLPPPWRRLPVRQHVTYRASSWSTWIRCQRDKRHPVPSQH